MKSGWARKATAVGLATALLAGVGLAGATISNAADAPGMYAHGTTVVAPPVGANGDWSMYLGSMFLNGAAGGPFGFCIEVGVDGGPVGDGTQTPVPNAALNYAIVKNQGDVSKHSALGYLAHQQADPRFNSPWAGQGKPYGDLKNSQDPQLVAIRATAAQIWADAVSNSGPYTVQPKLSLGLDGRTGTVTDTNAISAAGNALTGFAGTATLSGPAVWTGSNSQAVNLHAGDQLGFTATGNGVVSVTVNLDTPGSAATAFKKPGVQQLLVAGGTSPIAGTSVDVRMVFDFQPVATSTAVQYVEATDDLTDTLHVNTLTGNANDWAFVDGANVPATFDVDAYYSPSKRTETGAIPSDVKLVGSGKGTATGVGDVPVTIKNPGVNGYIYYVARFDKAAQPENLRQYFIDGWKAGFNDVGEQTIQKYQPKFHTVSSQIVDGKIHDVIEVTDNNPEAELSIDSTLYLTATGPVAGGVATAPADSITIGKVTTKVKGNGTFTTPALDIPWEKVVELWGTHSKVYVTWAETASATESTKPVTPRPLQPSETIELTKPTIVTKASENGTVPLDMHDTGVISGTIPSGPSVKVETAVKQYKFDNSTDGSAQAVCLNPSYESPSQEVTPGTTNVIFPTHRVEFEGTYGYKESMTVGVIKDGKTTTTVLHEGKCGEKNETVIGFKPNVPVSFEKPVLPIVQAGDVVATKGPNTGLLIGGGALALAGITIASIMVIRRKAAADTLADSK